VNALWLVADFKVDGLLVSNPGVAVVLTGARLDGLDRTLDFVKLQVLDRLGGIDEAGCFVWIVSLN
jgi:hypothetical protein